MLEDVDGDDVQTQLETIIDRGWQTRLDGISHACACGNLTPGLFSPVYSHLKGAL